MNQIEYELAEAISFKAAIKLKKKINKHLPNPHIRMNVSETVQVLCKMGNDVFNGRPEFNIAIVLMAISLLDAHREVMNVAETKEVIYL